MGMLLGTAILILDAIAILDLLKGEKDSEKKALWVILIVLLPLAGPILYYLLARR